jgi:hypothetical protein
MIGGRIENIQVPDAENVIQNIKKKIQIQKETENPKSLNLDTD